MTTKTGILAAAFSLLIISSSFSQDGTPLAKGRKGLGKGQNAVTPELRAEKFIKKWDKNGDGKLDQAELTAAFEEKQENRAEKQEPKSTATPTPKPTP